MEYDIVIVGAGPAGLSLAQSLAQSGLRIAIVEKQSADALADPQFDGRDIALTHLSVQLLKKLGVWERFSPDERPAIHEARVLDGASPYCLAFEAQDKSPEPLGYIVSNHLIRKALFDEVSQLENTELLTESAVSGISTSASRATVKLANGEHISCALIVAADSRYSDTRQMAGIPASMHDFGRVCIVARMQHKLPHDGTAFECFHYGRTLAVLPLTDHMSSIVVTAPAEQRDALMNMSEAAFSQDIQTRFGDRYGPMQLCTERFAYPLLAVHARRFYARRFALVGDAAVGMHPVTAHGFNLGLSGQDILAAEICATAARGGDVGAATMLERYNRKHMRVTRPIYAGTNAIVKAFTDDRLPAKIVRKVILRVANNLPPIKQVIRKKLTEERHQGGFLP